MTNGRVYTGCNVENASYGGTLCAERVAIAKAVSEGAQEIKAILVISEARTPWAPCGLCRQVMLEFSKEDVPVMMVNPKGKLIQATVGSLCPLSFSSLQMKKSRS